MSFTYEIPFITIFLAMLGGIATPFFRRARPAFVMLLGIQAVCAVLSAMLVVDLFIHGGQFTFQLGHVPAPWGNELRAGTLEAFLSFVFCCVMLLSMASGWEELQRDLSQRRQQSFCLLMHLQLASLLVMVYTNDLFTAYVFIEIAAICACMSVAAKDSGRSIVAAIRYLIFSCLGSGLFLLGIAILYGVTGHLLFEPLAEALASRWAAGEYHLPITAAALLMALGLALKSAQVPFHAWLPDAHSSATSAASAVLSGLVLKGYIVLVLKLSLRLFGLELLEETYMADLFFFLGCLGMIWASLSALKQEDAKRMVAYSSSAQISYIYMAVGMGTQWALVGACCQLVAHAVTKSMIYICLGSLSRASGGGHFWAELRGSARSAPLAGLGFAVGGLSLCGIPLFAGFTAKYTIAQAALGSGWHMLPALAAIAVSSVLNAMYYIPAILAIWGIEEEEAVVSVRRWGRWLYPLALILFLICNVTFGVFIEPVLQIISMGVASF